MAHGYKLLIPMLAISCAALAQGASQEPPANVGVVPSPSAVPAEAQPTATPAEAQPQQRVLPAGTVLVVTPMAEITSKHMDVGDRYQFQVVNDIVENNVVVIPRGSVVTGEIIFKTGRAIGGKSGKFEIEFRTVNVNGRELALMGRHRQEGRGNTTGALLGSILITGRSAVMLPGQLVNALTRDPFPY